MKQAGEYREQMNHLGGQGTPFAFLIDFSAEQTRIFNLQNNTGELFWQTPDHQNFPGNTSKPVLEKWQMNPVPFKTYREGFDLVQQHIFKGDTYLLTFTQPTPIETNLSLEELFYISSAPYKVFLKDQFVCFSPESFISITNGKIASHPMKGTLIAEAGSSGEQILSDSKELAEHHTIVDLIRNDLSRVAKNVAVEKFRYLEQIKTNRKDLWQVSSRITGDLPGNYAAMVGDILFSMLPAGSISGAPKKKTVEIIRKAEGYNRGFYTGVFGLFDGSDLDSCVLIRFIEKQDGQLVFKSGGGITFLSQAETEYEEMIHKVYVPVH